MGRVWLKPDTTRTMTDVEAAWLAGFFDGEGCLHSYLGGRNHKCLCWRLSATNTVSSALEKCQRLTGVGSLYTKGARLSSNQRQIYQWQINAQREMVNILTQILPYLTVKREVARQFLGQWQDI